VQVTMNERHTFCTNEFTDPGKIHIGGRGFNNEFGIVSPIGYEECFPGQWFHKIGTGMLKRDAEPYSFLKQYELLPVETEFESSFEKAVFTVKSTDLNGYAYNLIKTISLNNSSFSINYELINIGKKTFLTSEYVHNFLSLNGRPISKGYALGLSFKINQSSFSETVNPMQRVVFENSMVKWNSEVSEAFFFGDMNSAEHESCSWELTHSEEKIGIRETCYGNVNKVNLWGTRHVVSPEIFHLINLKPGEKDTWSRRFDFFNI
jgi:hypothetical protein